MESLSLLRRRGHRPAATACAQTPSQILNVCEKSAFDRITQFIIKANKF